jgi:3-oxoacyl-[acyl-carrier protein] reductase
VEIKGKVALITGGGTGLGRVIAHKLAEEGVNIAIHYSRSKEEAITTINALRELGVKAQLVQADLNNTELGQSQRLVEEVADNFGRLDLLINNAGTTRAVPYSKLDELEEADWDSVLNVNTKAPFFISRAAAKIMRHNGGGQIINTASISGLRAGGGSSLAYSVSKAALIHLTKCLAVALAPDIRVNAVAPGFLQTRWSANFTEQQLSAVTNSALLKKPTGLEDTANIYVMLAQNESITGQIITVDAGITV